MNSMGEHICTEKIVFNYAVTTTTALRVHSVSESENMSSHSLAASALQPTNQPTNQRFNSIESYSVKFTNLFYQCIGRLTDPLEG